MQPVGSGARGRRLAAYVVALSLLFGPQLVGSTASVADEPAPVGAPGIGDGYFPLDGNGGIDVLRYEVHDRYEFVHRRLSGRTRLTITATEPLTAFNLDLLLPVRSVTVDGEESPWSRPNRHELQITPTSPVADGQTFDVVVEYVGRPGRIGWRGESNWVASRHEVVAVNQPHMAAWWFPSNDHPRDKAVMDISITAPRRKSVVSNGELVSRRVHGGLATTRWRSKEPMAPYLAFFAAGPFEVVRGRHRGLPWVSAVSRSVPRGAFQRSMRLMKRSARLTRWLETKLGPYPFGSVGGVTTSLNPGFALENQGRPVYPVMAAGARTVVVHELAHQWFGNSVSVEEWSDIWLNEGAATFMEVRHAEARGGPSGQQWLQSLYDECYHDAQFWRVRLDDPGPRRLFDTAVYERGAMTFQALRHKVGEQAFWRLMRRWVADHRGGNASTADFEALAEEVTGVPLDAFFDVWLRRTTRPGRTAANGLG
ncbi:MAG: M1 family metallopeptidase [Nocardioides sp.]|nr:M1 family metallopeptidase [Nocardioides sp.]